MNTTTLFILAATLVKIKDRLKNVEFFLKKEFSASMQEGRFVSRQTATSRFPPSPKPAFSGKVGSRSQQGRAGGKVGGTAAVLRKYGGGLLGGRKEKRRSENRASGRGEKSRFTARFSRFFALRCTSLHKKCKFSESVTNETRFKHVRKKAPGFAVSPRAL